MSDPLCDQTILGARTRHRGVKAPLAPPSPWLDELPVCAELAPYDLLHAGIVEAVKPYRFVRTDLTVSLFLACLSGRGCIFVDGRWVESRAGSAVLLLPHQSIAYYAEGAAPWQLIWVCYRRGDGGPVVSTGSLPGLAAYDPQPLFHAVEGLRSECAGVGDPLLARHFVELLHRLVLRYTLPWQNRDPLHQVWEKVVAHLGEDWSLARLAREARYSGEHLRRLCREHLGRSPMQQVTHLRLQHAAGLLRTTSCKIEDIARQVGYQDAFAFSATFKKWLGRPPRDYRERRSA